MIKIISERKVTIIFPINKATAYHDWVSMKKNDVIEQKMIRIYYLCRLTNSRFIINQ